MIPCHMHTELQNGAVLWFNYKFASGKNDSINWRNPSLGFTGPKGAGSTRTRVKCNTWRRTCIWMPCICMKRHRVSLIRRHREYNSCMYKPTVADLFYIPETHRNTPCILFIFFPFCAIVCREKAPICWYLIPYHISFFFQLTWL